MDWVRNITDVVITSNTDARCNWFSYVYVGAMYTLLTATLLYIVLAYWQHTHKKLFTRVWLVSAATALAFTVVFYLTCQASLPRKNVL
jgi:hypothetical protein